jgi:hypothetical protein
MQANSKGHQIKSNIKQNESLRQLQHSYAEEVEIREEKIRNTARSSQSMVLAQTKDLIVQNPTRDESNLSHYSDDLEERSSGSLDDYRGHSDNDDDLRGNETYEPDSQKISSDHSDPYVQLREVSLEDDRQSYDPKRYHTQTQQSLGSTTDLPKAADNHFRSRQSMDTPDRNDQFTGTSNSQFSVTPKKNDLEKTTTLNSSGTKDRKVEIGPDGVKITRYSNGTVKYLFPDGVSEVRFTNGDIKTQNPGDSTLVYFYAQAKTTHTTYADGTEVYSFPTGQVVHSFSSPASPLCLD